MEFPRMDVVVTPYHQFMRHYSRPRFPDRLMPRGPGSLSALYGLEFPVTLPAARSFPLLEVRAGGTVVEQVGGRNAVDGARSRPPSRHSRRPLAAWQPGSPLGYEPARRHMLPPSLRRQRHESGYSRALTAGNQGSRRLTLNCQTNPGAALPFAGRTGIAWPQFSRVHPFRARSR